MSINIALLVRPIDDIYHAIIEIFTVKKWHYEKWNQCKELNEIQPKQLKAKE